MAKTAKEEQMKLEIEHHVKTAFLHKANMFAGKTESTLNKTKLPHLIVMGWTKNFEAFIVELPTQTHVMPSAAVQDTILTD